MKIAIIDYGSGNIGSVERAALQQKLDVILTRDKREIENAKALILPGVGAMRDAMENLEKYGLTDIIRKEVKKGKKLAGICLGMQALYESSEENGDVPALGILPGRIVRFRRDKLKVPHMGWNELNFHKESWIARGLPAHACVYFVHSYYKVPALSDDVIATSDYGVKVPAIVGKDNIIGFQFHPEKSGDVGIQLWKNLGEWLVK